MSEDTQRGRIRNSIIEGAEAARKSVVDKKFFGNITAIGENHTKAAEYLKERLKACETKGAEIKLHFEVEAKFNVALDVDRD